MRILYISILALVLLVGGYIWWWFQIASTMETLANDWREQRLAEGYEVSHDPLTTSGFPYRVRIDTENLSISNPSHFQKPSAVFSRFWAVVQPWQVHHVIFGMEGESQINWLDGSEAKKLDLTAASSLGSATFNKQGRIQATALDITELKAIPSWRDPMTAKRVQVHGRPGPRNSDQEGDDTTASDQQIVIRINDLIIDGMASFPLGKHIEEIALSSRLHGTIKRLPSRQTVIAWRNAGGFLDIASLKVIWGKGHIDGSGRLAIDEKYFPSGEFKSRISGYEDILQALVRTGKINNNNARTIGTGLNMLAQDDKEKGKYIALPLIAQDGGLYLGPLYLMPLTPLFKDG